MSQELSRLDLEFTFFDAINGHISEIIDYDNAKRMWGKGHALAKGEQGCVASHRALWNFFLNTGKPLLIMEDDIECSDSLKRALIELEGKIQQFEYIRLGRGTCSTLPGVGSWMHMLNFSDSHSIVKYMKGPSCAHAYILSPAAAEKFLSASAEWFWTIDDFIDKEYLHLVVNYGIEPLLAWQNGDDSNIGDRIKFGSRSIIGRIRKEYYRAKEQLLNNVYNYVLL